MKLSELLKGISPISITGGDTEVEIAGINIDSRKIEQGHLFVAIKGTTTDGHNYIAKAIELGASAVLCENVPENA
ncbi:Mur ligase domain-containing protein, partial [Parabacteroides distasonis]